MIKTVLKRSWNAQERSWNAHGTVMERSWNGHGTFRNVQERSWNVQERSWNVQERLGTVRNGQERWTLNGQERLGTFESERNNALELIVENVHGAFTFQKRKKHYIFAFEIFFTTVAKSGVFQYSDRDRDFLEYNLHAEFC
jgi:hypothetical protein